MSAMESVRRTWFDFLDAVQFLTRLRVPSRPYEADSLSRSVKFFPVVGLLIGGSAALLHSALAPHLSRLIAALIVVTYLVAITGCLHEDGLADAADGFGGGWSREQILAIMRDSRIGSYGAVSLILGLLARVLLLASLPLSRVAAYLIAAHVLCRWSTLPLSYFLSSAREVREDKADGQGARIAQLTGAGTFIMGNLFSLAAVVVTFQTHAFAPILVSVIVTLLSGLYYKRRIGGVTGDCFGATNQLTEIAVYLCGAWGQ